MDTRWEEWEEEIVEYLAVVENVIGRTLPDGYNKDTPSMRLTLDPVPMIHRPLLWYMVGWPCNMHTSCIVTSKTFSDRWRHRFRD